MPPILAREEISAERSGLPQLRQISSQPVRGDNAAGARACYAYFVAPGGPANCFRASPPRAEGTRAIVRWALDACGEPIALHTLRRAHRGLAGNDLELRAMRALGPDSTPRATYVDEHGRRTMALPLWDADVFHLIDQLDAPAVRKWVGRKLLRDVAVCLVKLHAAGVVHNDIKPENIFYRCDGAFVLADFDRAFCDQISAPLAERAVAVGSPAYPAPEFFDPTLPMGRAVDQFKLGLAMLSFYGGGLYDIFSANDGGGPARRGKAALPWHERPRTTLMLLEHYQQFRATGQTPPRTGWTPALHHRYNALLDLRAAVAQTDKSMEPVLFDYLLNFRPACRPSAAQLALHACRLLPPASDWEAGLAADLRYHVPPPVALRQQRYDLHRLARLPPSPPSPPPAPVPPAAPPVPELGQALPWPLALTLKTIDAGVRCLSARWCGDKTSKMSAAT